MERLRKWPKVISYSRELTISNMEQLAGGTGAKFLETTEARNGDLIAIQWRRKMVDSIPSDHILVEF